MKIKKVLIDGTIPRLGMIVVVVESSYGNPVGSITKIIEKNMDDEDPYVKCHWKFHYPETLNESIHCIRRATPQERKEWAAYWRRNAWIISSI